jgi:hypothetical protein
VHQYSDYTTKPLKNEYYELYALVNPNNPYSINFGARYGNAGEEYISGEAHFSEGSWEIYGNWQICLAAARFFANHT